MIVTRTEAIERGLKRYYTGKPCKWGHIGERFTLDRRCVICKHTMGNQQQSMYRAANREKFRTLDRARYAANSKKYCNKRHMYRAANREKIQIIGRARYAANRGKIRDQKRARYAANREKICDQKRARYAANREKIRDQAAYYSDIRYVALAQLIEWGIEVPLPPQRENIFLDKMLQKERNAYKARQYREKLAIAKKVLDDIFAENGV
jgi:hypothetical protein